MLPFHPNRKKYFHSFHIQVNIKIYKAYRHDHGMDSWMARRDFFFPGDNDSVIEQQKGHDNKTIAHLKHHRGF